MALERRLQAWVEAGLIAIEQRAAILEFEHERGRPLFLHAVAALGGLAIAIGLVSIVASNWDAIPGRLKLGIDFLLLAAAAAAVVRFERRGQRWATETSILLLYGLVLASIGLVGQVYQLGGEAHLALAAWGALTVLLMTRAHSGALAFVWLVGLQVTWVTWTVWLADGPGDNEVLALGSIYWAPLLCMAVGWSPRVRALRPALARVWVDVGMAELVLCGSLGTFAFYESTSDEDWGMLWPAAAVSAALTGWLWTRLSAGRAGTPTRWLLVALLLCSHLPPVLSTGDLDLVAALAFSMLWVLIAFAAHRAGHVRLLNLATAVIGVRILIVYFEVFGSLLDTGLGLVSGGVLTLGLVWLWIRKRRDFSRDLQGEPHRETDASP